MRYSYCLATAALLFLCQHVNATTVKLSDLLKGGTIQSGDKLFYDFHGYSSSATGAATAVDANKVLVSDYFNAQDQEYGIKFTSGAFVAGLREQQDTRFGFLVRALDPGALISDNTLAMEGSAPGTAYAGVIENAFTPDGRNVSQKMVYIKGDIESLYIHRNFSENLPAVLITKDIFLYGNNHRAEVTSFIQSFSQVPEPLTASATVLGLLALAGYLRRAYGRRTAAIAQGRRD